MNRWLGALLFLAAVFVLVWAAYGGYTSLRALEDRVAALETRLSNQEEALRGLADRLGKLEDEVFRAPAPPLSLPELPETPQAPAWPYAVGVVAAALLLYLILKALRGASRERPREGASEAPTEAEVSRMEDEGAPPLAKG